MPQVSTALRADPLEEISPKPVKHVVGIWQVCGKKRGHALAQLQAGRSRVPFPMMLQSFQPHCDPGVDSVSNRNEYQEYFLGGKGGRCVGLTLPTTCADCYEMWKPQPPGTLRACPLMRVKYGKYRGNISTCSCIRRHFFMLQSGLKFMSNLQEISLRFISNQSTRSIPAIRHQAHDILVHHYHSSRILKTEKVKRSRYSP